MQNLATTTNQQRLSLQQLEAEIQERQVRTDRMQAQLALKDAELDRIKSAIKEVKATGIPQLAQLLDLLMNIRLDKTCTNILMGEVILHESLHVAHLAHGMKSVGFIFEHVRGVM